MEALLFLVAYLISYQQKDNKTKNSYNSLSEVPRPKVGGFCDDRRAT